LYLAIAASSYLGNPSAIAKYQYRRNVVKTRHGFIQIPEACSPYLVVRHVLLATLATQVAPRVQAPTIVMGTHTMSPMMVRARIVYARAMKDGLELIVVCALSDTYLIQLAKLARSMNIAMAMRILSPTMEIGQAASALVIASTADRIVASVLQGTSRIPSAPNAALPSTAMVTQHLLWKMVFGRVAFALATAGIAVQIAAVVLRDMSTIPNAGLVPMRIIVMVTQSM
jgi:hypothetical protein